MPGLTTDLARDAYGLLDRLGTAPLKARWIDENGRAQRTSLNRIGLLSALADLDLRPNLRAEIPRAVSAARRGDGALLARLVAAQAAASDGKPSINNATVNRVTQCEEVPFPWDRSAAPGERLAQARARLAATPESAFAPVGRELAFLTSLLPTCAYWPSRPAPPDFGGPLPPVPALVLAGEADLRTPLESAEELRNSLPGSQLLLVPNAGHASLQGDTTGCARRAVGAFLGGGRAAACSTRPDPYVPRPLPPRSLRAAGGPVAAVLLTVDDALDQTDAGMFGLDGRERGGGLRGGTFQRSGGRLVLRAYELVAGVRVTGTVPTAGPARLRLGGAASGTLVFAPGGAVTGSLGGRPVHARARLERRTVTERVDARFGTPPVSVLGRAG